jgi:hypothetical protein
MSIEFQSPLEQARFFIAIDPHPSRTSKIEKNKKIKKSLWKTSIEFLVATIPHLDCNLTTSDQRKKLLKEIHFEKC